MAESHHERAEREREIIEGEGMSVDEYQQKIKEMKQRGMDMDTFRDIIYMVNGRATRPEDEKVLEISEKIESEKKKAEERKTGADKYTRWMTVFDDRFGAHRSVEVEVDEGSVVNLITKGMADDHSFEVQSLGSEPFRGETVNAELVCEEYVELALIGAEGQSIPARFYVLPANKPPNHPRITKPLVGRRLVQEPEGVLLSEGPKDPIWSTKLSKADPKMQEQSKEQAAKMKAYQANSSQARDAARKNQGDKGQKQPNSGSSSSTKK